jgi:glucokinase
MPDQTMAPAGGPVVAIDLGGTKATVAVVAPDGTLLGRSVAPTPVGDAPGAIAGFRDRAQRLPGFAAVAAVGLALPAIVHDGRVAWAAASVARWDGVDAAAALTATFGVPASVAFDGYAATMGEAAFGGAVGARVAAVLIIGTGFGAGVWYEDRVLEAAIGVAGAVGWHRWPVAADGGPDGVLRLSAPAEALASGPGILARARELGGGQSWPDTRSVFRAARAYDPVARRAVAEAALVAGSVAGSVINIVGPEVVVWSGGVGARADFASLATRAARGSCQPFAIRRTRFVRSRLGAESSLMGAAAGALAVARGRSGT